ncbi:hypothetical protein ACQKWADRAFT_292475 [Trichoderma austrokoningii]
MPLPFSLVCDLLEESYDVATARKPVNRVFATWCARHRSRINAPDINLAALLSTLLPEKRTDRVFCIQANGLERIIGRALMLGSSRVKELAIYKQPGLGLDLANCVERILNVTPNPIFPDTLQVTVEEIDEALHSVAAKVKWSSPAIRASDASCAESPARSVLETIYRRLSARDAKWFTRLILKDFQPLVFDAFQVYRLCDPILPSILKIREDFTLGIETIQKLRKDGLPLDPGPAYVDRRCLAVIKPQLSTKVGRQQWFKARSIKHCMNMCTGLMSVEAKVDGEYCQIHVDVSKGRRGVQIFSKSGKDSTEDRKRLIGIITDSLGIGKVGCSIKTECILEGELVVYSELEKKILPFHHIRKHVTRRGWFMNTAEDIPPRPYEHLMIVYYDILLLDGRSLLDVRHSERFKLLEEVVHCDKGQAELVQRQIINTNHPMAASALRNAFAKAITDRSEGLVLKADQPYFNFHNDERPFTNYCIKLKKDYIGCFGEVGDFAVVGAGFNAAKARSYNIDNLKWTHFYVGCIDNKEQVKRWNATPEFAVINVVELNEAMLKTFMSCTSPKPVPVGGNVETKLIFAAGAQTVPMTVAFADPPVFDMRCFSFDKAGNTDWWSLRFPSVAKIHFDRDYSDVLSFEELQKIAEAATAAPEMEDSQDNLAWIAKLEQADPRGLAVDAATQLTATTMPTPSPRRASHNSSGSLPLERSVELLGTPVPRSQKLATTQPPLFPRDKRKRTVSPPIFFSRLKKHHKASINETPRREVFNHVLQSESPARRALGEINGNSMQRPPVSASLSTDCPLKSHKRDSSNHLMDNLEKSKGDDSPDGAVVIPDSEDEDDAINDNLTIPSPSLTRGDERNHSRGHQDQDSKEAKISCQYAGSRCQLANRLVLLPLFLSDIEELEPLLRAHGISNVVGDAEALAKENAARLALLPDGRTEPNKILFVDSVDKEPETKALLCRLEDVRENIPEERREWISVYDWRVLNHVTIYEDEENTKKYYDGFCDPWRRWYCGLV